MTTLLLTLAAIVMIIALLAVLAGIARCQAAKTQSQSFTFTSESNSRFWGSRVQSNGTLGED